MPTIFMNDTSAEAKVSKFNVAREVKQDIVRFDVPVNPILHVNGIYRQNDLSNIKSALFNGENVQFK